MTEHPPISDKQTSASLLVSAGATGGEADIIIFGGGRGGLAILKSLSFYDWVNIHAIVDIDASALAFELANELGVATTTDARTALDSFQGNIIIDVTGNVQMSETLKAVAHEGELELISGNSARLMFDLVEGQLRNKVTIQMQNIRLGMLNSMLEITRLLESKPSLSEVTNKSFEELQGHVKAIKGLAIIFNHDGGGEVVGAIGVDKPFCDPSACDELVTACSVLDEKQLFHFLPQPIVLNCTKQPTTFNSILTLRQMDRLVGALLFDIQDELSQEVQAVLGIASTHLNMTIRTLDQYQRLEKMASLDGLTGIFNRRHFDLKLKEEASRLKRSHQGELTCALIDIDDFKQVNDKYGHLIGDQLLIKVASCLSQCIRAYDSCARYGGDEFVILLPSKISESHDYFERIANRILKQVGKIKLNGIANFSVSIGMATLSSSNMDEGKLLTQADFALYKAKKTGKSCLCIYSDDHDQEL